MGRNMNVVIKGRNFFCLTVISGIEPFTIIVKPNQKP